MNLLQRLHDSEIEAEIKTVQYHARPFHWVLRSPFNPQGKVAFGESPTLAEAEAKITEFAAKLFPDSEFAKSLEGAAAIAYEQTNPDDYRDPFALATRMERGPGIREG
jgi:hypothetical protein